MNPNRILRHTGAKRVATGTHCIAGLVLALGLLLVGDIRAQQIAVTFDDLPAHSVLPPGRTRMEVATAVISALRQAGAPPTYGFVNGVRIEEHAADAEVLDAWRKAGNLLGNHTWSHINLNDHTPAEFEADLLRNEAVIEPRMQGQDWRWLRYPFLAEGNTPEKTAEVREFLLNHHYRIAAVTMSFGDYLWNEPYARCVAKGDTDAISRLEASYLQAAADDATFRRAAARELFGHDIPYVLLMHIGAFDAHMLPQLLAQYTREGFHFVTLTQAESDPFYSNDLRLTEPAFPDSLEAALKAHHLAFPPRQADPPFLSTICR